MNTTIDATTVKVSTTTFRAWRKRLWAIAREPGLWERDWQRVMAAQTLYFVLGYCAGAALDEALKEWRKSGAGWDSYPVGAVASGSREDDEMFAGDTVDLMVDKFGRNPADYIATIVAMTGITAG